MSEPMEGMTLPADSVRGPNCGVTCVAILAGVSFAEAWAAVKRARAASGHRVSRWTGRCNHLDREAALLALGVPLRTIPRPTRGFGARVTLAQFTLCYAEAGVRYMVRTSCHVQIVKDRHVVDQTGTFALRDYWGRNKFVTLVQVAI